MFGKLLGKKDKGLGDLVSELRRLTVGYAKQETIDPLKGLVRYLVFGVAAAVSFGIGFTLWVVAGLRALQNETGTTFGDHLSWAPYLIALVGAAAVVALSVWAIGKEKRAARHRQVRRTAEHRQEGQDRQEASA